MAFVVLFTLIVPLSASEVLFPLSASSAAAVAVSTNTSGERSDGPAGPGLIEHVQCSCHTAVWRRVETVTATPGTSSAAYPLKADAGVRPAVSSLPFKPPRA